MALSVDNYRKRGRERPINDLSGGLAGAVWTVAEVDRRRGEEVEAADTELESGRLEDAHVAREHVVGVHQNRAEVTQLNNTIDTYLYDIQYMRQHNKTVHTHPFNGLLSRTTRVGRYQKKHSPTHTHPDHRTSFIIFLHLKRSMASSLFSLRA